MPDVADLAAGLAILAVAVPAAILCGYGLAALRLPIVGDAAALRRVGLLTVGLLIGVGFLAWRIPSAFSCFLSDAPDCQAHAEAAYLPVGLAAALLAALGALAGYGLLGRRSGRRHVIAGPVGGSVALLAATAVALVLSTSVRGAITASQEASELSGLEARDATVHVTTGAATAELDSHNDLTGARLEVTFQVDQDIALPSDGDLTTSLFTVLPPGQIVAPTRIVSEIPAVLRTGSPVTFVLEIELSEQSDLHVHGAWTVGWRFSDAQGQGYDGSTVFFLASDPSPAAT